MGRPSRQSSAGCRHGPRQRRGGARAPAVRQDGGAQIVAGEIAHARAAGLRNIAAELGYVGMAPFPLELLVEKRPDIIVLPEPLADTPALADLIALHPAIRALGEGTLRSVSSLRVRIPALPG